MKSVIITVAGSSTRFNEGLKETVPKCIYSKNNKKHTLLYRIVNFARDFDRIIIVVGFQHEKVEEYINSVIPIEIRKKIRIVMNDCFEKYGSGWSLYLGIKELFDSPEKFSEIVFVEGDLYFGKNDFDLISKSSCDVITFNYIPISADKAVAVYFDSKGKPKYIYDTNHRTLSVNEPFISIYNSAQIWKFCDTARLKTTLKNLDEEAQQGTNLVLINEYFADSKELNTFFMEPWVNTNTVYDFEKLEFEEKQ